MSIETQTIAWKDLVSKGFVHVKQFLKPAEVAVLQTDFSIQSTKPRDNLNYSVTAVSPSILKLFEIKLQKTSDLVRAATGIDAGLSVDAAYFATEMGVNFPWHQDHESYFIYQQHYHYLNFYMPFIKPDKTHSNLCLIPWDAIKEKAPEGYYKLLGSGAKNLQPKGDTTRVFDDENGGYFTLPINIEEIKVVPELEPGDLLLLRGDMIHRTQDASTSRVAISFRRTRATSRMSKARLLKGSPLKQEMIRNNSATYEALFRCFDKLQSEECTAQQWAAFNQSDRDIASSEAEAEEPAVCLES